MFYQEKGEKKNNIEVWFTAYGKGFYSTLFLSNKSENEYNT